MYQCIKSPKHLLRHLYQFCRYFRICYDSQPKTNPTLSDTDLPYTEDTPVPANHTTPRITNIDEEILPRNITWIQKQTPILRTKQTLNLVNLYQTSNSPPNKPSTSLQQGSNNPNNNTTVTPTQTLQTPVNTQQPTKPDNITPTPTPQPQRSPAATIQPTIPMRKNQQRNRLMHFQSNINWRHIIYNNTKARRYELTPFQHFLILIPKKGRSTMKKMKAVNICLIRSGLIDMLL